MSNSSDNRGPAAPKAGQVEFTGRYLVLSRQADDTSLPKALRDQAGLRMASSSDFPRGTVDMVRFGGADGVYLERLGIAVTAAAPEQLARMGPTGPGDPLTVERERVVYVFQVPRRDTPSMIVPAELDRLGPQSLDALVCSLSAPSGLTPSASELDETARTWGLVSTGVFESSRTGRGIRVAVLDTGFELRHPDFTGRTVVSQSFIEGEAAQDGHSHGTHCVGTALGPATPPTLPRYGVASGADVYVGKVLANSGQGSDGAILAAINWALTNGCRVISMSLGTATQAGDQYSRVFEAAAQRALAANTIIIAAAGNESDRRNNTINPVGHPANCPSIMAVGAVDSDMKIADFSTRSTNADGGRVDIVGPGVSVYSTVPLPDAHGRKSGTSMACPHVAGIAALYAEANPNATAKEIWQLLINNAKRLALDPADMGAGLVQAPR